MVDQKSDRDYLFLFRKKTSEIERRSRSPSGERYKSDILRLEEINKQILLLKAKLFNLGTEDEKLVLIDQIILDVEKDILKLKESEREYIYQYDKEQFELNKIKSIDDEIQKLQNKIKLLDEFYTNSNIIITKITSNTNLLFKNDNDKRVQVEELLSSLSLNLLTIVEVEKKNIEEKILQLGTSKKTEG